MPVEALSLKRVIHTLPRLPRLPRLPHLPASKPLPTVDNISSSDMPVPLPTLPVEIWMHVLQHLSTSTLKECVLVCRAWRNWAEKHLFSGVVLRDAGSLGRLLELLHRRNDIASQVYRLSINCSANKMRFVMRMDSSLLEIAQRLSSVRAILVRSKGLYYPSYQWNTFLSTFNALERVTLDSICFPTINHFFQSLRVCRQLRHLSLHRLYLRSPPHITGGVPALDLEHLSSLKVECDSSGWYVIEGLLQQDPTTFQRVPLAMLAISHDIVLARIVSTFEGFYENITYLQLGFSSNMNLSFHEADILQRMTELKSISFDLSREEDKRCTPLPLLSGLHARNLVQLEVYIGQPVCWRIRELYREVSSWVRGPSCPEVLRGVDMYLPDTKSLVLAQSISDLESASYSANEGISNPRSISVINLRLSEKSDCVNTASVPS